MDDGGQFSSRTQRPLIAADREPYFSCEEKTPHGVETRSHSREAFLEPLPLAGVSFCLWSRVGGGVIPVLAPPPKRKAALPGGKTA